MTERLTGKVVSVSSNTHGRHGFDGEIECECGKFFFNDLGECIVRAMGNSLNFESVVPKERVMPTVGTEVGFQLDHRSSSGRRVRRWWFRNHEERETLKLSRNRESTGPRILLPDDQLESGIVRYVRRSRYGALYAHVIPEINPDANLIAYGEQLQAYKEGKGIIKKNLSSSKLTRVKGGMAVVFGRKERKVGLHLATPFSLIYNQSLLPRYSFDSNSEESGIPLRIGRVIRLTYGEYGFFYGFIESQSEPWCYFRWEEYRNFVHFPDDRVLWEMPERIPFDLLNKEVWYVPMQDKHGMRAVVWALA